MPKVPDEANHPKLIICCPQNPTVFIDTRHDNHRKSAKKLGDESDTLHYPTVLHSLGTFCKRSEHVSVGGNGIVEKTLSLESVIAQVSRPKILLPNNWEKHFKCFPAFT